MTTPDRPTAEGSPPEEAAAPVITEEGTWGDPPPLDAELDSWNESTGFRGAIGYVLWPLLLVALVLWLSVLSLSQATGEELALPALERGVIALTEIDALIAAHEDTLPGQLAAGDEITLPGYPLDVSVPTSEVLRNGVLDTAALRDGIVARSAALLYAEGVGAFGAASGFSIDISPPPQRSTQGIVRTIIGWLSAERHDSVSQWVTPLAALSLVLALGWLWAGQGFGRFVGLAFALLLASALVLVGALLMRFAVTIVIGGDAVAQEFESIVQSLAGVAIRNALLAAAFGVALFVPAAALHALFDRSVRRRPGELV